VMIEQKSSIRALISACFSAEASIIANRCYIIDGPVFMSYR
jgi:hypothetical protein